MVEKAVSTLKVRDLLTITLTRWTSFISLTKTPLEEASPICSPRAVSGTKQGKRSAKNYHAQGEKPPSCLARNVTATHSIPLRRDTRLSPQCTPSAS